MNHDAQKTITTWYVDPDADDRMSDGHAPIWRHLIGLIVERDLSEKNVLDFGCNQGGLLRHLYAIRPFHKALGIDIAEQSIAKAETFKGNIPVQHAVGGSLDGWVEEFDLAISHEVIYLIEDIDAHAADIFKALKPVASIMLSRVATPTTRFGRSGASSWRSERIPSSRIAPSPITAAPSRRQVSRSPAGSSSMTASFHLSRMAGRRISPTR